MVVGNPKMPVVPAAFGREILVLQSLDFAEAEFDYAVDGGDAAAADADDLDDSEVVLVCRHDRPSVRTLNPEPLVEG